MTGAMPVVLQDWKPVTKGTLRGFARVRLGKALVIVDVPVLASPGKVWVTLPGKPLIGSDGVMLRDARGKPRYAPILEWADRDRSARFSAGVIEAIKRDHGPAALDEAAS